MAKITREQYNKWNAQAKNGFMLDLEYYCNWGEKTLVKNIKQPDNTIIQFKLYYIPEYKTKTNNHGCKWNVATGNNIPVMRIDRLIPGNTEGVYIVHHITDDKQIAAVEKSKKYVTLCKISGMIDTDKELKRIEIA